MARNIALMAAICLLLPGGARAAAKLEPILRLDLEGRWDENLVDDGGDISSLIRPGLGLRLRAPTARAELVYLPDGLFYGGGGHRRGGVNHRLVGRQELRFNRRTDLVLSERFERAFDPTALSRPGVLRTTGESSFAELQGDFSHRFSRTWTGGLRLREEIVRVEEARAVNGAVHSPEAWIAWALGPRDTVSLWYRYQYFESASGSDAFSHEPRLGWRHALTRYLHFDLEGGPALYEGSGDASYLPVGSASLVHRRPGLSLSLAYERTLFGATGFRGAVWGDSLTGVAVWGFARRWEATFVLGGFRNGAAPDRPAFVVGWGGAASVGYAFAPDLSLRFGWRRIFQDQIREGDLPALGISRNILGLGLSWELGRDTRPR